MALLSSLYGRLGVGKSPESGKGDKELVLQVRSNLDCLTPRSKPPALLLRVFCSVPGCT